MMAGYQKITNMVLHSDLVRVGLKPAANLKGSEKRTGCCYPKSYGNGLLGLLSEDAAHPRGALQPKSKHPDLTFIKLSCFNVIPLTKFKMNHFS